MLNESVLNELAGILQRKYGFATQSALDNAVADVIKRTTMRAAKGNTFSISKMLRGMKALRGEIVNAATAEDDVRYLKALTIGSTPGSYLVPTSRRTRSSNT